MEAKRTLAAYYPEIQRKIVALRGQGLGHREIQLALGLARASYYYHLHQAEKESGKKLL